MKVLITGGLGKTAEPLIDLLLANSHDVTILDIARAARDLQSRKVDVVHGDVCDAATVSQAVSGIDAAIHLAVNIADAENAALSFQTNVFGTYNLLMQAMKNGVKKVVVASSAPVHNMEKLLECQRAGCGLDYLCSPNDDFAYDLTKNIQELIARNFSQTYAMNNLVLRLGHIVDGETQTDLHGNPLSKLLYCRGGWVCRYDVAKAFLCAIESDFCGFHLLDIIGCYQAAECFEVSAAKAVIGFECNERFLGYPTA